eukprot:4087109-Prymnesium_polylepis.1
MQGLAHREGGVWPGGRPPCQSVIPLQRSTSPHSGHPHIYTYRAGTGVNAVIQHQDLRCANEQTNNALVRRSGVGHEEI